MKRVQALQSSNKSNVNCGAVHWERRWRRTQEKNLRAAGNHTLAVQKQRTIAQRLTL
jgi:hypothetical protein